MKTVQNPEHIERRRQQVMRLRELLDVLRLRLDDADRQYAHLFAPISEADKAGKREKDLQTLLAHHLADDAAPLSQIVLSMQFESREFEKAFDELYGLIIAPPPED